MLTEYVDYLNNLKNSITVSFGNTEELLEAYKFTALLLLNYAVLILIGLFVCWAVCKFISKVTYYAIKAGIKFDGVYSSDDEIADRFGARAIKVGIVTESMILLSYWFLNPTQLFLFHNMSIGVAQVNSMIITFFLGAYAVCTIYVNWYILAEAEVIKASIKPLTNSIYEPTNSSMSKRSLFSDAATAFNLYMKCSTRSNLVGLAVEENMSRKEFEKVLLDELSKNAEVWNPYGVDAYITKSRYKTLRNLCSM